MSEEQSNPAEGTPAPRDIRDLDIVVSMRYDLIGRPEYFVTPFGMDNRQTEITHPEIISTLEMAKQSVIMQWTEGRLRNV